MKLAPVRLAVIVEPLRLASVKLAPWPVPEVGLTGPSAPMTGLNRASVTVAPVKLAPLKKVP